MSWLFSRALVEAFSEGTSLDGEPSARSRSIHTPQAFLSPDRMTDFSRLSRFGMTFGPLTGDHGAALSTSFLEGFPARTSATLDIGPGSKASDLDSGERWPASLAKFDPVTSSWRTSQHCLIEGLAQFSVTWPRSGLMRDGQCWERPTWAVDRSVNGSGLWPTLKASDGDQFSKNYAYFERRVKRTPDLPVIVALNTPPTPAGYYGRLNPAWCEWLTGWPIGWTEFGALETDKIREWRQSLSASLQHLSTEEHA